MAFINEIHKICRDIEKATKKCVHWNGAIEFNKTCLTNGIFPKYCHIYIYILLIRHCTHHLYVDSSVHRCSDAICKYNICSVNVKYLYQRCTLYGEEQHLFTNFSAMSAAIEGKL